MQIKITANKISGLKRSSLEHFPKYTTYLINQAAQTAQATRPNIVGQLSDEYPNYVQECTKLGETPSLEGWKKYHKEKYPNAINNATSGINKMIKNFKEAIDKIEDKLIEEWVMDLLYDKTYYGFNLESTVKSYLKDMGLTIKDATAKDESKNIDLYVNNRPYQIKPNTLDYKKAIGSHIDVPIIFYKKEGNAIIINFIDKYLESELKK